jgi:hypothetical protein
VSDPTWQSIDAYQQLGLGWTLFGASFILPIGQLSPQMRIVVYMLGFNVCTRASDINKKRIVDILNCLLYASFLSHSLNLFIADLYVQGGGLWPFHQSTLSAFCYYTSLETF